MVFCENRDWVVLCDNEDDNDNFGDEVKMGRS